MLSTENLIENLDDSYMVSVVSDDCLSVAMTIQNVTT